MLVVCDEKLAAICVGTAVGHGHNATLGVLEGVRDFVWELSIGSWEDALAALSSACRVTSLQQKWSGSSLIITSASCFLGSS